MKKTKDKGDKKVAKKLLRMFENMSLVSANMNVDLPEKISQLLEIGAKDMPKIYPPATIFAMYLVDERKDVEVLSFKGVPACWKDFTPRLCPAWARYKKIRQTSRREKCLMARGNGELYCFPLNDKWGVLQVGEIAGKNGGKEIKRIGEELALLLSFVTSNMLGMRRLQRESTRDVLTGLYNRRRLEEALKAEVSRCHRHGHNLIVALIDIDHFKDINDSGGHDTGDELLRTFANCIISCRRNEDVVGRWGGDEFLLILPETSREDARTVFKKLQNKLRELPMSLTVSAGAVSINGDRTIEQITSRADKALYRAKEKGRDRIEF